MFQSYQSKQINPDENSLVENLNSLCGFNRINPNRSILTQEEDWKKDRWYQGFNRINPNRSIPTSIDTINIETLFDKFQSYQSKQINPDITEECK